MPNDLNHPPLYIPPESLTGYRPSKAGRKKVNDLPKYTYLGSRGNYYFRAEKLTKAVEGKARAIALGKDRASAIRQAQRLLEIYQTKAVGLGREKLRSIMHRCKQRAKNSGWEFNLSFDYLVDLASEHGGICALSGIPFWTERNGKRVSPWAPSIDRIDCTKGYVEGNVRFVCFAVNIALNEWGDEVLLKVARALAERHPPKAAQSPKELTSGKKIQQEDAVNVSFEIRQLVRSVLGDEMKCVFSTPKEGLCMTRFADLCRDHPSEYFEAVKISESEKCLAHSTDLVLQHRSP